MAIAVDDLKTSLAASLRAARHSAGPYPHWHLSQVLPSSVADELAALPFPVPDIEGVSGKRELHNKTRQYFDAENMEKLPVCRAVAAALQAPETIAMFEKALDVDLSGTYLRIEYAQDTDGFWLEPHTDLGVKKLTFLYYLSDEPGHDNLGTDIYADRETHVARSAFGKNLAMIFIPSDNTWHGFEKRTIPGVRKSIIINYVTEDWRAREQLAYPEEPVRAG